MENASKALIMAGAVLIAILILSIGIRLVGELGKTTESYVSTLDTTELNKYNSNFDVFIGRNDVTAQEIVTLVSIAQQKGYGTKVYVDGVDCTTAWNTEEKKNNFLNANILKHYISGGVEKVDNLFEYVDDSIKYNDNGRAIEIKFNKL